MGGQQSGSALQVVRIHARQGLQLARASRRRMRQQPPASTASQCPALGAQAAALVIM